MIFQGFNYFDCSLACSSLFPILLFSGLVFLVGWLASFCFEFWGVFALKNMCYLHELGSKHNVLLVSIHIKDS